MANLLDTTLFHSIISKLLLENMSLETQQNLSTNTVNDTDAIFHYTTASVLDSILSNARFWASNVFYLNDAKEYYSGIDFLKSIFVNNKSEYDIINDYLNIIKSEDGCSSKGVFSISFSAQKDNLHQWVVYSKEAGVCIQLDKNILEITEPEDEEENEINEPYATLFLTSKLDKSESRFYGYTSDIIKRIQYNRNNNDTKRIEDFRTQIIETFVKVVFAREDAHPIEIYTDDTKKQYTEEFKQLYFKNKKKHPQRILGDTIDQNLIKIWGSEQTRACEFLQLLASYFKVKGFEEEKEYRATFLPTEDSNMPNIKYFSKPNGILRPYLEVEFRKKTKFQPGFPATPIQSITIGPAGNQQAVFNSVVHRVKYGEMKVWGYRGKALVDKWNEYIAGALSRYEHENYEQFDNMCSNTIPKDYIETYVSLRLMNIWKDTNPNEWNISKIELSNLKKLYEDKIFNLTPSKKKKIDQITKDIINQINLGNFFSKEGIWIKKSEIPYIF